MTLTTREVEVLEAIARHGSQAAAGRAMGIRIQTVKNHLQSARGKLHVKSTVRAVVVAHRMGIIDIGKGKGQG